MRSELLVLGEPGLSLAVALYQEDEDGPLPLDPADVVPVQVTRYGGEGPAGEYYFTGLPDPVNAPPGGYVVLVFEASAPDQVLATYRYGGRTTISPPLVWRAECEPGNPAALVQHDTYGALELVVRRGLPVEIADATATCNLQDQVGNLVFHGRPASITAIVEDAVSGTFGATFRYGPPLQAGDTAKAGGHRYEFEVVFPGGAKLTVPQAAAAPLEIRPDINRA